MAEFFIVPDLKAILEESRHAGQGWLKIAETETGVPCQRISPQEPDLAKKLGMERKDNVFVFAGCYGDWANALNRTNRVTYSDLSRKMAGFAFEKYPHLKERACVAAGALLPVGKDTDWLFSFEPMPLRHTQLPLVLLQGMSHCKKGIITAYGDAYPDYEQLTREIADSYCAEFGLHKILLRNANPEHGGEAPTFVFKVKTTATAKQRATLDLNVMLRLQKKIAGTTKLFNKAVSTDIFDGVQDEITAETIAQIGNALKKSDSEIMGSLRRVTALSRHFIGRCLHRVAFKA